MWALLKKEVLHARPVFIFAVIPVMLLAQLPVYSETGFQAGIPGLFVGIWIWLRTGIDRTMDPAVFALPLKMRDLVLARYLSPLAFYLLLVVATGIITLPRFLPGLPDCLSMKGHLLPNMAFMAGTFFSWTLLIMAVMTPIEIGAAGYLPVMGAYLVCTAVYGGVMTLPFIGHESHRQDLFFPIAAMSLAVSLVLLVMSIPLALHLARKRWLKC